MPSRSSPVCSVSAQEIESGYESGYVSGSGSESSVGEVFLTKPHVRFLNRQLQNLQPQGKSLKVPSISRLRLIYKYRNLAMVYHDAPVVIPDHCFRSHRACNS